jgi:hypothetical protein
VKKSATVLITIILILGLFSNVALAASTGTGTKTATIKSSHGDPAKITVKYNWGTRTYGTTSTKIFTGCTGISSDVYSSLSSPIDIISWKQSSSSYKILDGGRTLHVKVTGVSRMCTENFYTYDLKQTLDYYFYKP